MKKMIFSLLTLLLVQPAFANTPLPTASNVDIARYVGKWYAVESLPQFFTRKCVAQTAEYGILSAQTISVLNTCIKKDGDTTDIEGKAVVKDTQTNARLEVTFNSFWTRLFRVKGEYVIIKLSEDYDTVMVGSSDRKSLWIMSRHPSIEENVLKEYKAYAKKLNFDVSKLVTSQF